VVRVALRHLRERDRNDVLGHAGVMQRMWQAQMSAPDAVWRAGLAAKEVFDAAMRSLPAHAAGVATDAAALAYAMLLNAEVVLRCAVCAEPILAGEETHWQGDTLDEVHADCCADCAAGS
jgi:ABC-type uncharacterized transport system permease subunit